MEWILGSRAMVFNVPLEPAMEAAKTVLDSLATQPDSVFPSHCVLFPKQSRIVQKVNFGKPTRDKSFPDKLKTCIELPSKFMASWNSAEGFYIISFLPLPDNKRTRVQISSVFYCSWIRGEGQPEYAFYPGNGKKEEEFYNNLRGVLRKK